MSDPDGFDALLAQRFEHEHAHVSAEPFVAATMQQIRIQQRQSARLRNALRIAAVVAAVAASPWLIAGATRLNNAVESSFAWTANNIGLSVVAAIAAVVVGFRVLRSR